MYEALKKKQEDFLETLYNCSTEKHWPTFPHTVTCSTVAERRGGGSLLSQCSMAGGAGRGKKQELSL